MDGNGRILIPLFLYKKEVPLQPMFYLSEYLESNRDEHCERLQLLLDESVPKRLGSFFFVRSVHVARPQGLLPLSWIFSGRKETGPVFQKRLPWVGFNLCDQAFGYLGYYVGVFLGYYVYLLGDLRPGRARGKAENLNSCSLRSIGVRVQMPRNGSDARQ